MGWVRKSLESFRRWLQRRLRRMVTYAFVLAGLQFILYWGVGAASEYLVTGYVLAFWTAAMAVQWSYRTTNPKNRPKRLRPLVAISGLLFLLVPAVSGVVIFLVFLLLNGPLGDGFEFAMAPDFLAGHFYFLPTAIGIASLAPSVMRERGTKVEVRAMHAAGLSLVAMLVLMLVSFRSSAVLAFPTIIAVTAWVQFGLIVHRIWNPHVKTDLPQAKVDLDDEALLEQDPWMALRRV